MEIAFGLCSEAPPFSQRIPFGSSFEEEPKCIAVNALIPYFYSKKSPFRQKQALKSLETEADVSVEREKKNPLKNSALDDRSKTILSQSDSLVNSTVSQTYCTYMYNS